MDFGTIIILIAIFIILVIGYVATADKTIVRPRYYTEEEKGRLGEESVAYAIAKTFPEGYLIENLIIPSERGCSTQIDQIVLLKNGVFVIETKNYSGMIYGSDDQKTWTQVLNYGKTKNKFYNPVKQNATHVYRLKRILGNVPMKSIVVFFQNNTENIDSENVYTVPQMLDALRERLGPPLSQERLDEIYSKLMSVQEECAINSEDHVQNVQDMLEDIENNICPRCRAKLKLRKGKNGDFYGCTNYPKCTFTKNK